MSEAKDLHEDAIVVDGHVHITNAVFCQGLDPWDEQAIGIDLRTWLEEGLVDVLVGGGYTLFEPWEHLVELGHAHDVPVYPCLSGSRIGYGDGHGIRGSVLSQWRGEAAAAWKAGADGVYLFNTAHDPTSPIYSELGSPESLRDVMPSVHAGVAHDEFLVGGERFIKLEN